MRALPWRSRAVVNQAIGIISEQQHCDADTALTVLRAESQRANINLYEVCARLVARIGEPPDQR
jgi:AmiR/NasT family two-component response regulator